jgi:uncharacterized membrane protein
MDIMNEKDMLIMVAGYGDLESARHDFADLNDKVKQQRIEIREAVLVGKGDDGVPTAIDTRNRHGRVGAGWGAGVGLLVGLVTPPLMASVAIGATAGMVLAKLADHGLKSGLRHEVAQALVAGTGVVVVVLPETSQPAVERLLAGRSTKSVVCFAESTIATIEKEIAAAMSAVTPIDASQAAAAHDSVIA